MPRGSAPGERRGGRKRGTPNKRTAEIKAKAADEAAELAKSGETPLAYMLRVMRDDSSETQRRDAMAAKAAPYVHPTLSSISMDANVNHYDRLTDDELAAQRRAASEALCARVGNRTPEDGSGGIAPGGSESLH